MHRPQTKTSITRRAVMLGTALLPVAPALGAVASSIAKIEKRAGGRLGVAVLDTQSGRRIEHRAHERFAMCSTFKFLLATAVLARIDAGSDRAKRFIAYGQKDLVTYSPVTEKHVGEGGMRLSALCQAAIENSDNTAANLLLATIGGPAGWTGFARALGDPISRLDRTEPYLNSAVPGDPRDTTTPDAMLDNMQKVLLGKTLSDRSWQELEDWMVGGKIGVHRLRAGVPADWLVGDKPGTGQHGACNDIAILRPPERASILACVYFAESNIEYEARETAIADVGRVIAAAS